VITVPDIIYAPKTVKEIQGVKPYEKEVDVLVPQPVTIKLARTICPYSASLKPTPRECESLMSNFKGFVIMADQGRFEEQFADVTPKPKSTMNLLRCPTHPLGPKTVAITHSQAIVRGDVSVTFLADKVGLVKFQAYVVVDMPDPMLGRWFQLSHSAVVLPYAPPPPPPAKSAQELEVEEERADALQSWIDAGLSAAGESSVLDGPRVLLCAIGAVIVILQVDDRGLR